MKLSLSLFLVLLFVLGIGWAVLMAFLFKPPATYLFAFSGGLIIGSVGGLYWLRYLS